MNLIQCRMARAALDWTTTRLARESGILSNVVIRYLAGKGVTPADVRRMRTAFEEAGITFIEGDHGPGVCLRMQEKAEAAKQATDVVVMMEEAIDADSTKRRRLTPQA